MNYYDDKNEIKQYFVSDGKILWMIFKDQNIAISENINSDKSKQLNNWNVNRLLKEYIPSLPKDEEYKVKFRGGVCYKVYFVPKSNTAGFKSIYMIIDQEGSILKIMAKSILGYELDMEYVYKTFDETIDDNEFEFEPDEETQVYENILIPQEED